jgi:hypothetical protein
MPWQPIHIETFALAASALPTAGSAAKPVDAKAQEAAIAKPAKTWGSRRAIDALPERIRFGDIILDNFI